MTIVTLVLLEVVRVLLSESKVEVVMFCKTHRDFLAEGHEAAMAKRYRTNIKHVFLENKLSGQSWKRQGAGKSCVCVEVAMVVLIVVSFHCIACVFFGL